MSQKVGKSTIQNVDFFIRGGHILIFFINVDFKSFSWTKNKLVLMWFLCNFKCFKLMFLFLRGWLSKFKIFPISNFSQIKSNRGAHQICSFSQIQKSPKHPRGGGGKENCGLFPLFGTFLIWMLPLEKICQKFPLL